MGEGGKRKKHHDKDRYYRLAKEQGLRSRAAFKLTQINRNFSPLLENCNSVLDLCAAPGGWTQIAARTCSKTAVIVAVDILPIRHVARNVTTIVGDITTQKCKSDIQRALATATGSGGGGRSNNNGQVDLVLHDGAPNIGADYNKDAYAQNELSVHALQCACRHLVKHGTFITKLYRSRDYNAYLWVLQQLFESVTAFKPKASRAASAEIFLVAQRYKAPKKLDPRFLDPKHVFASIDEHGTGTGSGTGVAAIAGDAAAQTSMTIFHKNWDKKVRKRGGYDMDYLDATMCHVESVNNFVSTSLKEAIQMLSRCTGLGFTCPVCNEEQEETKEEEEDGDSEKSKTCHCHFFLHHPLTTPEVKQCIVDLKVLNKTDFKGLLSWRTKMQESLQAKHERDDDEEGTSAGTDKKKKRSEEQPDQDQGDGKDNDDDSEQEEAEIQAEIAQLRQRRLREKKKVSKKERAVMAKRRRQAALGMDLNAIDITGDNEFVDMSGGSVGKIFSLSSIQSKRHLDAAAEVNLDQVTDEVLFGQDSDDDDVIVGGEDASSSDDNDGDNSDDDAARTRRREKELDEAYNQYLQTTKNGLAKSGTKHAKRSKKLERLKLAQECDDDQEMALAAPAGIGHDTKAYIRMLQGPRDDDDSDDDGSSEEENGDDDEDGYNAKPMTPQEHAKKKQKTSHDSSNSSEGNPLIHKFADESTSSAKTARWFSNPLFARIGSAAGEAATNNVQEKAHDDDNSDSSDSDGSGSDSDHDDGVDTAGKKKQSARPKKVGLSADDVLDSIPKTDKQIRHERRLKAMARDERRKARRAKRQGEDKEGAGDFELAPALGNNGMDLDSDEEEQHELLNRDTSHLSEAQKKKVIDARELIKAGMGTAALMDDPSKGKNAKNKKMGGIEIVPQHDSPDDRPLPVKDHRKYDSDHEDYDSDDYARTLALGTMMLRRSKEKALVDASYNRYAWNDPEDLPEWFVDDETRHYRPQLPIPPALLAKMKEKMMALSTKPIAKVAEARARKSKRAKNKLAAAKKTAEALANSSDMSEAAKLKSISKALRGQEARKPGKTYVVAKKGRGNRGGKGVKVVDKREKCDKRAMNRVEKRRKKGKQNGLVGSKKRRHHS